MDVIAKLKELGFHRVEVLDGPACGIAEKTVLLAIWTYEMEIQPEGEGAWIHPYYRVSHRAYTAAKAMERMAAEAGMPMKLRDDVRLKPIFARLPGFSQGRNTLSYLQGVGSRFYVKTFALDIPMTPTLTLDRAQHGLHCGACRKCMTACPTGAITEDGFVAERCLRWWMMNGKPAPEEIRRAMGKRFIGCDECQRCCPHNPPAVKEAGPLLDVHQLLTESKYMANKLKDVLGVNLALPNRVLAQACLVAGCSGNKALEGDLAALAEHPSETVRIHAAWALDEVKKKTDRGM